MSFRASLVDDFIAESTINALVDTRVFDMFFEFEDFLNSKANAISSFPAITIESDTGDTENNLDSHDNLKFETLSITIYQQVNLQKLRSRNPTVRTAARDNKRQVDTVADAVTAYILDKRGIIDTYFLRASHISSDSDGVFETEGNREIVTREISYVVTYSKISQVPVNITVPIISGTLEIGELLTTTNGTWTNSPTSFTYKWLRDDVVIVGQTASTYTTVLADGDAIIKSQVIATDGGLPSLPAESVGSSILGLPVNTVIPVVTGTTGEGDLLTTTTGTWTNTPTSFTYRWLRDDVAISGATSSTYTIVAADISTTLKSEVTAINGSGTTAAAAESVGTAIGAGNVPEDLGATFAYDFIGSNASTDIIEGATNVNVAGWQDRTSNDNDAIQSTASEQPTFTQTDGPITFDGSNDSLDTQLKSKAGDSTYIFTINTSTFGARTIMGSKVSGASSEGIMIRPETSTSVRLFTVGNTSYIISCDEYSGIKTTFAVVISGTSYLLYQNGSLKNTIAIVAPQESINNLFVGRRSDNIQFYLGTMSTNYLFPRALNATEIGQMQTYIDGL